MMELIVNGDDFGLTRGVNDGIVRAYRQGILTSATLMANGAAFDDAVEKSRDNPGLGVGVHLCLVGGRAVAPREQIPALADENGDLPKNLFALFTRLSGGLIPPRQIEIELRAQIARVLEAGIRPSHLDTHKHTHTHPRVMEALGRVANEFGIRNVRKPFEDLRVSLGNTCSDGLANAGQVVSAVAAGITAPWFHLLARSHGLHSPDHFFGLTLTGNLSSSKLEEVLRELPAGKSELMCHPGVCDEELQNFPTRLKQQRQIELDALTGPAARRLAEDRGIRLIRYEELSVQHAGA
jgi:hopanoid biosynthesis associated protein HpnK